MCKRTYPVDGGIPLRKNVETAWEMLRGKGYRHVHGTGCPLRICLLPRRSAEQVYAKIYREINLIVLLARDPHDPPAEASFLHEVGHFFFPDGVGEEMQYRMAGLFPCYMQEHRQQPLEEVACDLFSFAVMECGGGFLSPREEGYLGELMTVYKQNYPHYFA